LPWL
jgi:hypothetical protein